MAMDLTIWALSGGGFFWPVFSLPVVAIALAAHAWWLQRMPPAREQELVERVDTLHRTRSGALDVQAAELRRIERDLHDGAQARMVSLAMNLGLASELLKQRPGRGSGAAHRGPRDHPVGAGRTAHGDGRHPTAGVG